MGCGASKSALAATSSKRRKSAGSLYSCDDNLSVISNYSVDDAMHHSLRTKSKRQRLAWHREIPVTDVYNILEIVGQGSMGEVTIVQKKVTAIHAVKERAAKKGILKESSVEDIQAYFQGGTPEKFYFAPPEEGAPAPQPKKNARKYACKTVNTLRMKDEEIIEFINEVDILRDLDHPNIVQLFEVYRVKRKLWIITELCTGGDLTSRMDSMTECDVAIVMEQILRAVTYMHKRNVCHRDIKLENVMYASPSRSAPVKLIDFGLSNKFTIGEKMLRACGTIYAAAPELLFQEGYTEQTDIWSIGVVAFVLLSENYPFLREVEELMDEEKRNKLANAHFTFGYEWTERKISKYAKEFVAFCLRKNPSSRWSAKEAKEYLEQEWIGHLESLPSFDESEELDADAENSDGNNRSPSGRESVASIRKRTKMDSDMVQGLNKFILYGELKKTILMTMAYTMDKSSLHELQESFEALDASGDGVVTLAELKVALKKIDHGLDDETIEKLFHGINQDRSGSIHYNEFLAAVVESQGLITMEHLADAFDRLDKDSKGYISKDDLKDLLGSDYNEETVDRMINEADYKKNGQVDYDEFLRLMFEDPTAGMNAIGTRKLTEEREMVELLGNIEPSGAVAMDED